MSRITLIKAKFESMIELQKEAVMDSEMESQLQLIFELLSQVFGPIFLVLVIVSFYYETLYCYCFFMSGLTLPEISQKGKKKNNLKGKLEMEKKEHVDEVLEKVTIDKKQETIKN